VKDNRDRTMATLRSHFEVVTAHFKHSEEAKRKAWVVARQHPYSAYRCYKAIVNSLESK
jgi:hypothetical protein